MLSPEQCRIRREALGWTVGELARRARMSKTTVRNYEHGQTRFGQSWLDLIERALAEGERRERVDA
jgi:transcriptional regulator with XRE-family HTH domain